MAQSPISIRELKDRLGHYLRLVRAGESVLITDRGVPVGRIVPIGQHLDQCLAAMCEAGQAQWNGRKLPPRKPVTTLLRQGSVAQLIVEDRG